LSCGRDVWGLRQCSVVVGDILPADSPVLHELLIEELASDEKQLQQTLTVLREQRTSLKRQIEEYVTLSHIFSLVLICSTETCARLILMFLAGL